MCVCVCVCVCLLVVFVAVSSVFNILFFSLLFHPNVKWTSCIQICYTDGLETQWLNCIIIWLVLAPVCFSAVVCSVTSNVNGLASYSIVITLSVVMHQWIPRSLSLLIIEWMWRINTRWKQICLWMHKLLPKQWLWSVVRAYIVTQRFGYVTVQA